MNVTNQNIGIYCPACYMPHSLYQSRHTQRQMKTHSNILVTITLTISLVCLARADEPPCNSSSETEEVMMMMEPSLMSQRFMEEKKQISYGALKKDQPACGRARRGHSYTKTCLPQPSNHYTRGCSKIYRCRRDSK